MMGSSESPAVWVIVGAAALGIFSIGLSVYVLVISSPAELQATSAGNTFVLPGWAWITGGMIFGVLFICLSLYGILQRRR